MTLRTFPAEGPACSWWLETQGPRGRGSPLDAIPGRSTSEVDVESTLRRIERAICTLPLVWRGVVVVAAGWRMGPQRLDVHNPKYEPDPGQLPPLERANLPPTWRHCPAGLTSASLRVWRGKLLAELVTAEIVTRRQAKALVMQDTPPVLVYQRPEEERMERALFGWKVIADAIGVSEDTAQRWAEEEGLPVARGRKQRVMALPSQLQAWMEARVVASLAAVGR